MALHCRQHHRYGVFMHKYNTWKDSEQVLFGIEHFEYLHRCLRFYWIVWQGRWRRSIYICIGLSRVKVGISLARAWPRPGYSSYMSCRRIQSGYCARFSYDSFFILFSCFFFFFFHLLLMSWPNRWHRGAAVLSDIQSVTSRWCVYLEEQIEIDWAEMRRESWDGAMWKHQAMIGAESQVLLLSLCEIRCVVHAGVCSVIDPRGISHLWMEMQQCSGMSVLENCNWRKSSSIQIRNEMNRRCLAEDTERSECWWKKRL